MMTDKCTSPEGHKYISEWNEAVGQGWIRCKNCSDIPEPHEIARRLSSLTEKVERLRQWLAVTLDCADYTAGNCRVNEMVGAVLPTDVIKQARAALLESEP